MKKTLIFLVIISFCISCKKDNPTDPKVNNNETVTIGTQIWMVKNLDVDHFRNGDPIPEVKDSAEWAALTTGAWCYYNHDPALGAIYGKLYNWYAVNDPRGLAPVGWHVPSDNEWTQLTDRLGGENVAGGKLKTIGTKESSNGLWKIPNTGATNESGFSALPGGCRNGNDGSFYDVGGNGSWWSATEYNATTAWCRVLFYEGAYVNRYNVDKGYWFSVRCVRDF